MFRSDSGFDRLDISVYLIQNDYPYNITIAHIL
jgi:hypothetical protein